MKFNEVLKNLSTYEAGKPIELVVREYGIDPKEVVKLASNENPYGTSPKVVAKIETLVKNMYLYPDDSMFELKEALANKFKLESKNKSNILIDKTTLAINKIYEKQVGAKIIKTESSKQNLKEFYKKNKKHG